MGSVEDGDNTPDVKARLVEAWGIGNIAETCGILVHEVVSRFVRTLSGRFGHQGISYEDCEDCVDQAIEGLLKRTPDQVRDPYNYVYTSAYHACLDIIRERKPFVRFNSDWQGNDDSLDEWDQVTESGRTDWNPEAVFIVAEVALEAELAEITDRERQLYALFRATIPKLVPNRRRLIEALLERGANIANATLAEILARNQSAVKSLKSRTFGDLRRLLPITAEEIGLNFDLLVTPDEEILTLNLHIPSEEDDSDFLR